MTIRTCVLGNFLCRLRKTMNIRTSCLFNQSAVSGKQGRQRGYISRRGCDAYQPCFCYTNVSIWCSRRVRPPVTASKEAARCHLCNSGPVQRRNQGGAGSELRGKLPSNPAIPTNLQPVRSSVRRSAFACALVQLCTSAFSGSCMLIAGNANARKCATFAQNQCSDLVCMAQRRQPGSLTRKGGAKESNKRARRKARRSFDMPCALV